MMLLSSVLLFISILMTTPGILQKQFNLIAKAPEELRAAATFLWRWPSRHQHNSRQLRQLQKSQVSLQMAWREIIYLGVFCGLVGFAFRLLMKKKQKYWSSSGSESSSSSCSDSSPSSYSDSWVVAPPSCSNPCLRPPETHCWINVFSRWHFHLQACFCMKVSSFFFLHKLYSS